MRFWVNDPAVLPLCGTEEGQKNGIHLGSLLINPDRFTPLFSTFGRKVKIIKGAAMPVIQRGYNKEIQCQTLLNAAL